MSRSMQLHYIPVTALHTDLFLDGIHRFIFRWNLLWMRLPWKCHNQLQETNWHHCVAGPALPFFHKRKGVLKIDQSVKTPWHRLSMGVASSCSSAPDDTLITQLSSSAVKVILSLVFLAKIFLSSSSIAAARQNSQKQNWIWYLLILIYWRQRGFAAKYAYFALLGISISRQLTKNVLILESYSWKTHLINSQTKAT